MRSVQESLAGRVGILEMSALSENEKNGRARESAPDFTFETWNRRVRDRSMGTAPEVFESIWRGGLPEAQETTGELRRGFFSSYVDSYLLRDVVELGGVRNLQTFRQFLRAAAALTSQQLNYAALAETAEISQSTAKSWIDLLAGLGAVRLLAPFSTNLRGRLARRPKLYFADTGLAAYLTSWPTSRTLMDGPMSGAFFENHVVLELMKLYEAAPEAASFSYFRDRHGKEIDLLVETDGVIHPLEIKKSGAPSWGEAEKFGALDKLANRGAGGIVCLSQQAVPLSERDSVIPVSAI